MSDNLIIIGSVTYALKGKEILFRHGISAYITRNTKTKEYGCGYSLYIPNKFNTAIQILRENNIKILAITSK